MSAELAGNIISKVLGIAGFLIVVALVWRLWSRQEGLAVPKGSAGKQPAEEKETRPTDSPTE